MGRQSIRCAIAAAWLLAAGTVNAAGLGRLTVLSALGQPLVADIAIVAMQRDEEDSLSARLASPEAHAAAGVEFNAAFNTMRVSVERVDKAAFVRVITTQPLNEPFLDVLIELASRSGSIVRQYTFLLDPPERRTRR